MSQAALWSATEVRTQAAQCAGQVDIFEAVEEALSVSPEEFRTEVGTRAWLDAGRHRATPTYRHGPRPSGDALTKDCQRRNHHECADTAQDREQCCCPCHLGGTDD